MSGKIRSHERVEKSCVQCSTVFSVANYRKNTAVFCSRSCQALASRVQHEANCKECGRKFSHIASRANKAKYCGNTCYYKSMSRKGSVEHSCQHCGQQFLAAPSKKRKFCSKACINKAKKENWAPTFSTVRKTMVSRQMLLECERCGYNTEPKILGVHHKDRNRHNNALENLEVLCPICHSLEHRKHTTHGFRE